MTLGKSRVSTLFVTLSLLFVSYVVASTAITSITIPNNGHVTPTPTPSPTTTPTPTPTPTFPPSSSHRLLPISGKTYLGAWFQASNAAQLWQSNFNKGIAIGWYMSFMGPVTGTQPWWTPTRVLNDVAKPAIIAGKYDAFCLTLQPQYTDADNNNAECIGKIANGEYDPYIRSVAQWINTNFPYPLVIRFAHEMNINAWGWGANNATYITAWQRIVTVFREENCEVSWFWCPSYSLNGRVRAQYYYPGDAYVDWIGVDMYSSSYSGPQDPVSQLTSYDNVWTFSVTHNKPFMVGEWGMNIGGVGVVVGDGVGVGVT